MPKDGPIPKGSSSPWATDQVNSNSPERKRIEMKMVEKIKHVQNLQVKVFSANSPSPDLNPLKPPLLPFFSCSFLNLSSDSVSLCFQVFTFKNKFQQRL